MQKINGQLKYYKWLIILLFFVMAYYMSWTETDFYFLWPPAGNSGTVFHTKSS